MSSWRCFRLPSRSYGRRVRVHVLQNARSGTCSEDCSFCSQSVLFNSKVPRYLMQPVAELITAAERAVEMGAVTFCMVTSTRGGTVKLTKRVRDSSELRLAGGCHRLR